MRKRKARKAPRKTARKATRRSKAPAKTVSNAKAHWEAFRSLQKRVDASYAKLRSHLKKKASAQVIRQDRNELLLLLGECNYMAKECARCMGRKKK